MNHNYTLGDRTFFNEIKKIPPGVEISFLKNELIIKSRFKNINRSFFGYNFFKKEIFNELNLFAKSINIQRMIKFCFSLEVLIQCFLLIF